MNCRQQSLAAKKARALSLISFPRTISSVLSRRHPSWVVETLFVAILTVVFRAAGVHRTSFIGSDPPLVLKTSLQMVSSLDVLNSARAALSLCTKPPKLD